MFLALTAAALAVTSPFSNAAECKSGYTTTIVVQDPNGAGVPDANVELNVLCGNGGTTSAKTDESGEAQFHYAIDDLGNIRITFAGFGSAMIDKGSCSGPATAKRCIVKFGS